MDWLALQSAVQSCQACGLCAGRKNTVFGTGQPITEPALAPRVDWLIVGEAPGENEDLTGEPFVGQAGKLLDSMLHAMVQDGQRLSRHHNVFIANVLKCRPPSNRNPSTEEVARCQPYLQRQIALLQPKIILAMGRFAVQSLLGSTEPLGKLRGRVHYAVQDGAVQDGAVQNDMGQNHAAQGLADGHIAAPMPIATRSPDPSPIPVIVTYHPSYLLRNLPDKAKAWADLLLAMETLQATGQPNTGM